jgi:copper chaperone CopZ
VPTRTALQTLVLCAALLTACRGAPKVMQVEIAIEGMTCDSCVQAITHELTRLEGVRSVEVDLDGGKALVTFTEGESEPAAFERAIEKIGYEAEPGQPSPVSQ